MTENADGRRWWHGAVIYQLYVRSWRDSNDDGYGDLRGIIERLDYLSWLGVDAVWLSPTMPSPDDDWGYDVSDYTGVHPELGTLADLDELIEPGRPAGHAGAARPGAEPHQLGAPLVRRRRVGPRGRAPPLLRVGGSPAGWRPAEQLARLHRPARLAVA